MGHRKGSSTMNSAGDGLGALAAARGVGESGVTRPEGESLTTLGVRFKNIEPRSRKDIKRRARRLYERQLGKHLRAVAGPVRGYLSLERDGHHGAYAVSLRLRINSRQLISTAEDFALGTALADAFDDLEWRLRRVLKRRRWRRAREVRRGDRWHQLEAALSEQGAADRQTFALTIANQIEPLTGFVHREIEFLRADGRLPACYPDVADVLDEVLVRILEKPNAAAADAGLRNQCVIEVLAEFVAEHENRHIGAESLESEVDDQASEQDWASRNWLDEALQPDELWLSDTVPDSASDAADIVAQVQTRRAIRYLLRRLPTRWRRAVTFLLVDELPTEQVRKSMGMSDEELRDVVDHASAFLREAAREAGLESIDINRPAKYVFPLPQGPHVANVVADLKRMIYVTEHGS